MKALALLAISMSWLVSGSEPSSQSSNAQEEGEPIQVIQSVFGQFSSDESSGKRFSPGTKISFTAGGSYGWVLTVKTSKATIRYREELTLPKPIAKWGLPVGADQTVSSDGQSAVAEREAPVENGKIHGGWSMVDGDPLGRYVSKVTLEDGQVFIFEFDVE